ncbi:NAD(P)H-hydrate dehydratase [Sneathiella marina]|uniref:Bifunctional NAD(P)H-hydrate repair enzyme n=1 Tax=Sneathiella marina TaxID=2950108 RepID=A0ABY4W0Q0_9PROT|nr:NAD(P)H-hydrate dehydratase [Sneathiella marina]USG59648.1 NAD(P)H-hydrate dehydratase [Sneathiella marina]
MTAGIELLTTTQMYQADRLAIEGGVPGIILMEAAGRGVAETIQDYWETGSCLVICGPGNNGGDGYVIARHLQEEGWRVILLSTCDPEKLSGDAAIMRSRWEGPTQSIAADPLKIDLVVDAVFGAGFSGTLAPDIVSLFATVKAAKIPVVAVDVPSGVNGNTGAIDPGSLNAAMTVTFYRAKPGHYLYPARASCGQLEVIDIGIKDEYLETISPDIFTNTPEIWKSNLHILQPSDHKYSRGHLVVVGGGIASTGAARIASRCSLRAGAGAVTVISPPSALTTYAVALEAVMVRACSTAEEFLEWVEGKRIGTILIGPGCGLSDRTVELVIAALNSPADVILDADALTVFKDNPDSLFELIRNKKHGNCIMTPHEAEFARLFSFDGSKMDRARQAADRSNAIILLKGADTVIASPHGQVVINHNAPANLATAGSGDALAGIIAGLVSAKMSVFYAAAAAAWMHGEAGTSVGPGLIAEDIEEVIPAILSDLHDLL